MIGELALEARVELSSATLREKFLELIGEYGPAIRRLASAYTDQPSDREDLFQEIAIALWQALPKFRGESSQRTWLYRIAHNVAISHSVRMRRRGQTEEAMPEPFDAPSANPSAEMGLLESEKLRLLRAAIRNLSPIDRQIVMLHLEGLSYQEIEKIAGISQTAIAARLTRAREKLKREIVGPNGGAQ